METLKFNQIYSTHKKKVTDYVKVKVYPHLEITDEIVDDIFMKVYHNFKTFDEEKAAISTWIFTITNNTLKDYFRSIKPKKSVEVDLSKYKHCNNNFIDYKGYTDAMYNLNSDDNADNGILYDDSIVRIRKAINKMDCTMQTVAKLRFLDQYKYAEISKELDMPINTVKTHINRAKEFISKYVQVA